MHNPVNRFLRNARVWSFASGMGAFLFLAQAHAGDWPQFLGPTRDGVAAREDLAAKWPAGGPPVVWKMEVGHGFAGPVAAGGKLILFHRMGDVERVECMDALTGKPVWAAEYPTNYQDDFGFDDGPRAMPTIAGDRVYTFGAEGALHCWDFKTGKQVWAVDTKKQFAAGKGYFGMACSPLVEGNAVVLNLGGGDGAGVVAFDKESGKVLWKATDDEASYSSPIAATIHGTRYVFVFTRAGLVGIDPPTGKVLFRFPWRARMDASVNAATPLVVDDMVFISASYNTGAALLRIGEKGPEKIWSGDDAMSNHYATCVVADGFLYGFDGRQEHGPNLRCVELKTGKVRWSEEHFGAGNVLLAGKQLLVLTEKGELISAPASPEGFKPTGRAQILGFGTRAYPALADGLLYARGKDKLVCMDLRGGGGKAK
jgi:outer membrane protein assembly factor BamB